MPYKWKARFGGLSIASTTVTDSGKRQEGQEAFG